MSGHLSRLIARHFPESRTELVMGGLPVSVLAEIYGTPLFIYDGAVMDTQLDALRAALPAGFELYFSIKANPNPSVVSHFLSRGCGLEVASAGEFQIAIQAGCKARNIVFSGPGKTEAELEYVLSNDIGEIHIESLLEATRISSIARRLGLRARTAIRVNPASDAEGGAMRMGGRPAPFGVDEEVLDEAVDAVCTNASLEFRGIHLFVGTQILDAAMLVSQYRHGLAIARRAALRAGCPLATLDFGGGWGIPYFAHEQELNLACVSQGLGALFAELQGDPLFSGTSFLIEPGRFLTAEAGVYVTRVNDIKVSRGKRFVIVDGGMNHCLGASGNLGQTIKRNYPVALVNRLNSPSAEPVDVVGPLCTPLDKLARDMELPAAQIFDLFGIFQSGAYGRSASPLGFLSHPAPPEVWVYAGRHRLVAERGSVPTTSVPISSPRLTLSAADAWNLPSR
jgi:diaminopimelate decarboxylase